MVVPRAAGSESVGKTLIDSSPKSSSALIEHLHIWHLLLSRLLPCCERRPLVSTQQAQSLVTIHNLEHRNCLGGRLSPRQSALDLGKRHGCGLVGGRDDGAVSRRRADAKTCEPSVQPVRAHRLSVASALSQLLNEPTPTLLSISASAAHRVSFLSFVLTAVPSATHMRHNGMTKTWTQQTPFSLHTGLTRDAGGFVGTNG